MKDILNYLTLWKEFVPEDEEDRAMFYESKRFDDDLPPYAPVGIKLYTPLIVKSVNGFVSLNDTLIIKKITEIFKLNFDKNSSLYSMGLGSWLWNEDITAILEFYQEKKGEIFVTPRPMSYRSYILNESDFPDLMGFEDDIIWNEEVFSINKDQILKKIEENQKIFLDKNQYYNL